MSDGHCAFILAGTGSGCGKTTVTLGLLHVLQQQGMRVQPFKVGPDYLDTAWHTAITGVYSRNLDSFMLPEATLNALFNQQMPYADVAVIEGGEGPVSSKHLRAHEKGTYILWRVFLEKKKTMKQCTE